MTASTDIKEDLERLAPWHFDIDLGHGVRTSDANERANRRVPVVDPKKVIQDIEKVYPEGLSGRTLLDVACNGGAYCIFSHWIGASYTYGFDARQHWIDQAEFLKRYFEISNADFRVSSLSEAELTRDYDISIFKGILYHVPDPVSALMKVCERTKELILIDSESDGERGELCFRLNAEGTKRLMTGVDGLAWWPSGPDLIEKVVEQLGFPATREVFWRANKQKNRSRPGRFRIFAARDESVFEKYGS